MSSAVLLLSTSIFVLNNTAYALWSGIGNVAITIISVLIWKEKINVASITGIALILIDVLILNLFGPEQGEASNNEKASESTIVASKFAPMFPHTLLLPKS
ncbi:SMR family transporter [Psychrobacillus sp. NEAU-3TGS]|nr:SMR family transporter [Psychrobacillus sp. NEAU-3TGS]MDI2588648.1 SMR family transporter [Psychrobacillus sp. NEAU-3TGS]